VLLVPNRRCGRTTDEACAARGYTAVASMPGVVHQSRPTCERARRRSRCAANSEIAGALLIPQIGKQQYTPRAPHSSLGSSKADLPEGLGGAPGTLRRKRTVSARSFANLWYQPRAPDLTILVIVIFPDFAGCNLVHIGHATKQMEKSRRLGLRCPTLRQQGGR
jgi:hypothetical protein